jgi:hypothetical protein
MSKTKAAHHTLARLRELNDRKLAVRPQSNCGRAAEGLGAPGRTQLLPVRDNAKTAVQLAQARPICDAQGAGDLSNRNMMQPNWKVAAAFCGGAER